MGDLKNILETHDRKFYFNAQKCELSKVQILLACFLQNKYWCKVNIYWYIVFKKSRRKFSGRSIENKTLCHQQQNLRHENNKFWSANIKSCHQRKTFWEIFATFKFSIVLLAAHVNRKIESDMEFSGRRDQVTLCVYSRSKGCQNDGKTPGCFVFVSLVFFLLSSVIKFDKKCANSTQRSLFPNSWGWPMFLQSQKFNILDEVIYHQLIPSFWK